MDKIKVKTTVGRSDAVAGADIEVSAAEAGRLLAKGHIVPPGREALAAIKRAAEAAEAAAETAVKSGAAKKKKKAAPAPTDPAGA